jgi:hypothetical protein
VVNAALPSILRGLHAGLGGVNDAARRSGIAVGVAAFGALVPAAAAVGHGSALAYVDGLPKR